MYRFLFTKGIRLVIKPKIATRAIKVTLTSIMSCFLLCIPSRGETRGGVKASPNPLLLIQGMVSTREQIPPSRLWLRVTYSNPFVSNDHQYLAEFDGNDRHFVHLEPDELKGEIAYDGKEVSLFDGVRSICVTDLGETMPGYGGLFFDPRLLGITDCYQPLESVDNYNHFQDNKYHAELVGSEIINGEKAWHVREVSSQATFNWWIDDKHDFRVYRYRVDAGKHGTNDVNASYNTSFPWLPKQVDEKHFNESGKLVSETHIAITKSEVNVAFSTNAWSLAGMNLPTSNLSVTDLRLHQIVGFWDGHEVVPFKTAFPHPAPPSSPPLTTPKRTFFLVVLLILAVVPLVWLIRNSMRRS